MNKIDMSLIAIQNYKPANNVFLKVVGEGKNQHLEAVKINWFGRILMWCGCSNASMIKVAKFVEQNMQALCSTGRVNLQDPQNPIGTLVSRLTKYSSKHPKRISHLIPKIKSIYNKESLRVIPYLTATTQSTPSVFLQPSPQSQPPAATIAVAPLPKAAKSSPAQPEPVISVQPPTPPKDPIQDSVDRFKAMRGHVGKVAVLFLKIGSYQNSKGSLPPHMPEAITELTAVKQLITDCSQDPLRLAAVIKEMTDDEVGLYIAAGLLLIAQDIFDINQGKSFNPSPLFTLAVKHMSIDQLKAAIGSIDKYVEHSYGVAEHAFYNLAFLTWQFRSTTDQAVIFTEMVKQPSYKKSIMSRFSWAVPQQGNECTIATVLAESYICHLLRDPATKQMVKSILHPLYHFMKATHFVTGKIACHSPLQNMTFLTQLSLAEQNELALAMAEVASNGQLLADSVLIANIVLQDLNRAATLFPVLIGASIKGPEFCPQVRQSKPYCDRQYVLSLLQALDRDNLKKFIKAGLPDENSVIEDPAFIQGLTETQLMMLIEAIFDAVDLREWNKFYAYREKIIKDEKLAKAFYDKCNASVPPKAIPFIADCIEISPAIAKTLVSGMRTWQKRSWRQAQLAHFQSTDSYKALPSDDQKARSKEYSSQLAQF